MKKTRPRVDYLKLPTPKDCPFTYLILEDLYPVLTVGGSLFIVPEEARRDIFEMRSFLQENQISGGCYTTLFGQMLAGGENSLPVDYICPGGEAMTSNLNTTGKVYNTYGSTEFTVDAAYFELEKDREYNPIPIGRPLYNCAAFIVGTDNELLPLGRDGRTVPFGSTAVQGLLETAGTDSGSYYSRPLHTTDQEPSALRA